MTLRVTIASNISHGFSNTIFPRVEYEGNRTRTHNSSVLSRAHHLPGLLRLRSCSSNCFYHVTHAKGYGLEVLIRCIYTRPANRTSFMRTENWSIFSKNAALSIFAFSSYHIILFPKTTILYESYDGRDSPM